MSTKKPAQPPTHCIYAVSKGKSDKSFWNKIGAAWRHADGKGFSLKLEFLPLNGAELVLREARQDAEVDSSLSL